MQRFLQSLQLQRHCCRWSCSLYLVTASEDCPHPLHRAPPLPQNATLVQDVMAAMRSHWDGTEHDPYLHQHPNEPWRPIALLRTGTGHGGLGMGLLAFGGTGEGNLGGRDEGSGRPACWETAAAMHVVTLATRCAWLLTSSALPTHPPVCSPRCHPPATPHHAAVTVLRSNPDVPDALSIITYAAFATPKLSPFVPLYKGLPGSALPLELAAPPPRMDSLSLFWRARRLQALVFQVRWEGGRGVCSVWGMALLAWGWVPGAGYGANF